jgi:hypothetical protein
MRGASNSSFVLGLLIIAFIPAAARAQSSDPTRWGLSVSVTPTWELADQLKRVIEEEDTAVDIRGSEVTVGFVRGRRLGGDWGVSFVHKPFKDGSGVLRTDQSCFPPVCFRSTESAVTQGVSLTGVEVHWFIPFVTIKERGQVGINVAGGIANVSGTFVVTTEEVTTFTPPTGPATTTTRRTVESRDAAAELIPQFPLAKLELEGAVIVGAGLKVKVAGGLNFPAYSVRVGLVYLIGG